jgi:hypothetical protein
MSDLPRPEEPLRLYEGQAMTKDEALQLLVSSLQYNQETGHLIWVKARSHRIGKIAGHVDCSGYRKIGCKGYLFRAHRLCWFIVYGAMPKHEIDHINGVKDDNRLCNLREATLSENRINVKLRSDNASGFKGVRKTIRFARPFRAEIQKNGKRISLGCFETAQQAHEAYVKASINFHGEFANSGESK